MELAGCSFTPKFAENCLNILRHAASLALLYQILCYLSFESQDVYEDAINFFNLPTVHTHNKFTVWQLTHNAQILNS